MLRGTAKVSSIQVNDPNLAGHLQAPDFFDAERDPELTFASRDIHRDGDKLTIDGEITIKGHPSPSRSPARSRTRSTTPTAASASG